MKTLKILTLSILIISALTIGVRAETQQELDNRTIYKGSDLTKAVQSKYKTMNLSYLTENELNQAVQSDINYFKTSPNAEMENANADGSQIITMYKEGGKYIVVLGYKPTVIVPMEANEVKEVAAPETIAVETEPTEVNLEANETNSDFEPRVVFDAQTEEKAKQEQKQYKSLFPLSGLWYLLKHYPLQTAGSMILMLMCLVYIGTMESNEKNGSNNGSGKGDNQ